MSNGIKSLAARISAAMRAAGKPANATAQAKYFKGVCKFYGLKVPEIKSVVSQFRDEIKALPSANDSLALAEELLSSEYLEDKRAAADVLNTHLRSLKYEHLPTIELFFDKEYIYDWSTCDTISSTIICEIMKKDPSVAQYVRQWKSAQDRPWKQRAACVSFVKVAKSNKFNDAIIEICETTVQNPHRFVQLGTGWVLRELWLANKEIVKKFIQKNVSFMSREGLRYAIEKMDSGTKDQMLSIHSDVTGKGINSRTMAASSNKKDDCDGEGEFEDEETQEPPPKRAKTN